MSERFRLSLATISIITGIVASAFTFVQAYAILPYRMEQSERQLKVLGEDTKQDHELLVRIEERLKDLQQKLDRLSRRNE